MPTEANGQDMDIGCTEPKAKGQGIGLLQPELSAGHVLRELEAPVHATEALV